MICAACGRGDPMCPTCGKQPPNAAGGSCAACIATDAVRVQALSDAIGVTPDDIVSTLLEPLGKLAGKPWHELTAADVTAAKAKPGGVDAIAAAVEAAKPPRVEAKP